MGILLAAAVYVSCFGLSCFLTKRLIQGSKALGMIDSPNHRSSHNTDTPKGGGLAIFVGFNIGLVALYELGFLPVDLMQPLLLGSPVIAILGWLDDKEALPAKPRLLIHFAVSTLVFFLVTDWLRLSTEISFLPENRFGFSALFCVLFISWFINLYNFMDGIDGIVAGTTVVASFFLFVVLYYMGLKSYSAVYGLLTAVTSGFLLFNWSPAKIFMGDTGAYLLGFIWAAMALIIQFYEGVPLHFTVIPFGFFIVDATYTLAIRIIRKENIFRAHRQHAFQKMIRNGCSHSYVASFYALVCLLWLCPMTLLVNTVPRMAHIILVVAYLPLLIFVVYQKAGTDKLK